jgi:hypothetical protein
MSVASQLSSMSTSLGELTARLSTLADDLAGGEQDGVANALFEVERALEAAARRLEKLVDELG